MAAALLYLFLCLVWGSTWLVIRVGLKDLSPYWSLALRIWPALIFIIALAVIRRTPWWPQGRLGKHLVIVGLLVYPVGYGLVYWAEQYVTSGLAAVMFAAMPFFVALLSWRMLPGEQPRRSSVVGLVVGIAGLVTVYWAELAVGNLQKVLGMGAISLSAVVSAYTTVTIRRDLATVAPVTLTAWTLVLGAVVVPGYALIWEGPPVWHLTARALWATAYLGIVASGLAFVGYYHLLSRISALTMSLIAFITPLVALVLGALFDYESLSIRSYAGIALVLLGVLLAARGGRK